MKKISFCFFNFKHRYIYLQAIDHNWDYRAHVDNSNPSSQLILWVGPMTWKIKVLQLWVTLCFSMEILWVSMQLLWKSYFNELLVTLFFRRKCTFSPYILTFFHFSPYILILPLLVFKPINACYFHSFCQSTDGNI